MYKLKLIILFALLTSINTVAQIVVRDSLSGKPIPNVNVLGKTYSTITNNNGEFDIKSFSNNELIALTHVSYKTKRIKLNEIRNNSLTLRPNVIKTDEVKITGSYKEQTKIKSKELITLNRKEQISYNSSAEIVNYNTTLFVRDYGGYTGLKTVSSRGLSSENTLVLFNEAKVNDIRTGTFDLSVLGNNTIDKVELIKNSDDEYYGPATGGVLKFNTSGSHTENFLDYGFKTGSYNSVNHQLGFYRKFGKVGIKFSGERAYSKNDYDFRFEGKDYNRTNSHYSKTFAGLTTQYTSESGYTKLYTHYSALDNGLPGFVLTNNVTSGKSSNNSTSYLSVLTSLYTITDDISLSTSLSYHTQQYSFRDPSNVIIYNQKEQETDLLDIGGNVRADYSPVNSVKLSAGFLTNHSSISKIGNFIGATDSPDNIFASNYDFYSSVSYTIPLNTGFISSLIVSGGAAYQFIIEKLLESTDEKSFSWKSGFALLIDTPLLKKLRFNYSDDIRLPTVNERYFSSYYDFSSLKKEEYHSFEAGAEFNFDALFNGSLDLNYFNIDGKNKIVWVPYLSVLQVPRNVKSISSEGVEVLFNTSFFNKKLSTDFIYTYTVAKNTSNQGRGDNSTDKLLIYSPKHQVKINLSADLIWLNLSVRGSYISSHFYTTDNNPFSKLDPYFILDTTIGKEITIYDRKVYGALNIYNLLNTDYLVIQSYPMPLRTYAISFNLEIL